MKLKMIFENAENAQRAAVGLPSHVLASFLSGSGSATAWICPRA